MRKKISILFFCWANLFLAQQLPQFTQFSSNVSMVNNANFVNDANSINFGARSQMLGFGLEPNTAFCFGNYTLKKKEKTTYNPGIRISRPIPVDSVKQKSLKQAIAFITFIDRYGAFSRTHISGVYNVGFKTKNNLEINGAIKLGYSSLRFNQSDAIVLNPMNSFSPYSGGDTEYDEYTSAIPRVGNIDVGASLMLSYKKFKFGVSADQLTGDAFRISSSKINFDQRTHASFLFGYTLETERKIQFEFLSLMKKMPPAPLSIDLSARAVFPIGIWFGVNYRHRSSLGLSVGANIKNSLRIGYAYDIITTQLNGFSKGGHEIVIGYAF
ncbi:MAG: PorP/SprF family type IX secretion system membrane protein [Bacteroidota bacterium]|jgi:type IX secretion system PorP/SprF family membrane protein